MFKRTSLHCITLALLAAATAVRAQQDPPRQLRILVEGEPSVTQSIIEALHRNSTKYDLRLEFAGGFADRCDLRLIVTTGTGTEQCSHTTDPSHTCDFSYLTAAALAPDGKLLFTITQPKIEANDAAVKVIRKIYSQGVKPARQAAPDLSLSQEAIRPIDPAITARATAAEQAPAAESDQGPGVYYKNDADWIRIKESRGGQVVTRGMGKSMLTFGASGLQTVRLYSDPSAEVQFSKRQPEFYLRGIAVSEQDIVILRLQKKSDHREVQIGSVGFGGASGYRDKDILKVKSTRISDGLYKVIPATELKPGEYILYVYRGGYEFGVAP